MKKEAYYFPHDSNARNDDRIIAVRMKYGAEGYGIYFMIIEKLRESADYKCVKDYNIIAFDLRVDASIVKSIVEDFGLFAFTDCGKYIYSDSLLRRMNPLDKLRKKRSDAGKSGMEIRWKSTELQQSDNTVITELQQSDNNKNKVYKSNINPPLPPLPGGAGKVKEKTWRDDFEMYLTDLREAYKAAVIDTAYMTERAKYHPGLNIQLSLEKACKEFWATEAGWKHKKKSRSNELNWRATFTKALDQPCNRVWITKQEKENETTTRETKIVG